MATSREDATNAIKLLTGFNVSADQEILTLLKGIISTSAASTGGNKVHPDPQAKPLNTVALQDKGRSVHESVTELAIANQTGRRKSIHALEQNIALDAMAKQQVVLNHSSQRGETRTKPTRSEAT